MTSELPTVVNGARQEDDLNGLIFELAGIEFAYNAGSTDELKIFAGLSEPFKCGEFVSLLGPSGCGKTTLLDIIAGISEPTGGSVQWHLQNIRLGYLFQEYPFLPQGSVHKHVAFPLLMSGEASSYITAEVDSWLRRLGLADYHSYPISSLSSGMKARVALATVLIGCPQALLLDEPFRALDIETRVETWRQLKALREAQTCATLLVTHDLNEAIALSDRVLIFSRPPVRVVARVAMPFASACEPMQRLASPEAAQVHQELWAGLRQALITETV